MPVIAEDQQPWPISLTCNLYKLAGRMIASRLLWWLEGMGLYHAAQIGFSSHFSTEDGLEAFSASVMTGGHTSRIHSILLSLGVKKSIRQCKLSNYSHCLEGLPLMVSFIESFLITPWTFSVKISG